MNAPSIGVAQTPVSSTGNSEAPSKGGDLTPMFSGMEKDCGQSNEGIGQTMRWLMVENGKPPSKGDAPGAIRSSMGSNRVKIKDQGDFWDIAVALTNATYHGLPVKEIARWSGKGNGINGIALVFSVPMGTVKKTIGMPTVGKNNEETMPMLSSNKKTNNAMLVCDFSD